MATIPASENEFPEVLFAEGAAPGTPASGLVKAYAKSDGLLYSKDDAGTETPLGGGDVAAHLADTTDAHDASAVSFDPTGLAIIAATEVQTALEELDAAVAGGSFDPDQHMPWTIDVNAFGVPATQTNWNTITIGSAGGLHLIHNAVRDSSAAQNDEIGWDVILAAGTWTIELIHRSWSDRGIYAVSLAGSSVGTIDGYTGSDTPNTRSTINGISVASTGKKRLLLKMATKNGSSSNYRGAIQHVRLLRTA